MKLPPITNRLDPRQRKVLVEVDGPSNQAKGHDPVAEVMESADSVKARLVKARGKGQVKGLAAV
jgi:hypothetical protein